MASEDSDELVPGFLVIHRLSNLSDLDQTLAGQMSTFFDDLHAPREPLEIVNASRFSTDSHGRTELSSP
jgi:hypothetical protein